MAQPGGISLTPVKFRIRDDIAIVTMASPPSNGLTPEMRAALAARLEGLDHFPEVRAVILLSEGEHFSLGQDVREVGEHEQSPSPAELCNLVEGLHVPVIAAIQGLALGAGAELALAAHFRVMEPDARIGLPQVTMGLVPGAGATQRLPRLIGADPALRMMLTGKPVTASAAREIGLANGVVVGHLATGAMTQVKALLEKKTPWPRTLARRDGLEDGAAFMRAIVQRRRQTDGSKMTAPGQIVDCVEAALLLPGQAGLAFEASARLSSLRDPQSRALRGLYMAERRIASRLLSSAEGRRTVAEPDGLDVVSRLRHALGLAIRTLREMGESAEAVDAAMASIGFAELPFGTGAQATGAKPEVVRRIVAALMAEGSRQVESRKVDRASDIDVLSVYGLAFPKWRGGPMRMAQELGLLKLQREMSGWAEDSSIWAPTRLLGEAIKFAGGFDQVVVLSA
ncbi:enoyl-CoA hydratase/isomerase family protein [Pelagovum pacificum]|nr:enoyl-CoA hydratase/isomerase family protein [Pelagovum pacificum]